MITQINVPVYKREVVKRNAELGARQKYILRWAKKIKAVKYKGGKCCKCGETRLYVLVFHHIDPVLKENSIEKMMTTQKRWSDIQTELDKCDLVCENCHREIHCDNANRDNGRAINKEVCLSFKNVFKCTVCGYSKCNWALEFHHNGEKTSGISKYCGTYSWNNIGDLQKFVIDELNRCEVYCSNCHKEKHFNVDNFNKFSSEIYDKSQNLSEKNPIVDKLNVLLLLKDGKTAKEVAVELNCSYIRVYEISKEYGISINSHIIDKKQVLDLWAQGKTRKQIMLETCYSKSTVNKAIRQFSENKQDVNF